MSALIAALRDRAARTPEAAALRHAAGTPDYGGLLAAVERGRGFLEAAGWRVIGLLADNGPDWVIADLAALAAGVTLVPLPGFFSAGQLRHAVTDAGVEAILTDTPEALGCLADTVTPMPTPFASLHALTTGTATDGGIPGVAKLTYTSGTTGTPKGVCLSAAALETVARSLVRVCGLEPRDRHLAALPFATLLENIGGIYAPLLAGASVCVRPLAEVGMTGSSGLDPQRLHAALVDSRAGTSVFIPQMLQALVEARESGASALPQLRLVAVGGAPVSPRLLSRAEALGLPVFEGYGLSESASVVAVNAPGARRAGSVGRPLPHVRLRVADDGELMVSGASFAGYLGEPLSADPNRWIATGDLGAVDEDGFVFLEGRKKHIFISGFGRNIAPEWIERELILQPAILQAAVFGEARPWNVAIVVPTPGHAAGAVEAALQTANAMLPDYARIGGWIPADAPFTVQNLQLTGTGRLRREQIAGIYGDRIEGLYAHAFPTRVQGGHA